MSAVRVIAGRYGIQVVILGLLICVLLAIAPDFIGQNAAFAVLERLVPLGIITAGIAATMIIGELDLSVASMAAMSGASAIVLGDQGLGLVPVVALLTAGGLVVGAAQGWMVARIGISSLVLTVGTLILFRGVAWLVTDGVPVSLTNYAMTDPLLSRVGVLSPLSITALVVIAVIGVVLSRTRPGKEMYAVGGARQEALAAGVPLARPVVLAFAISGGCGALAGAMSSLRSGSATPDGFTTMLLLAVAAALVGGIGLRGGRGGMVNVLLGVFITATLAAGLASMGVKSYVSELVTGVLLLAVVAVDAAVTLLARQRELAEHRRTLAETPTRRTALTHDSVTPVGS